MMKTDILIIGCGAVGVAIAREFAHYNIKILVRIKTAMWEGMQRPPVVQL